ncbi:hypothetical protein [Prevotella sp. P5-64]|uniref:hypothetical protein n=1 Tax=Prevotella sp. P5-64 TaxID=2024226 RepID=UPI00130370D8|nr:hypothetical protein [Prevotella sp. P5-64]
MSKCPQVRSASRPGTPVTPLQPADIAISDHSAPIHTDTQTEEEGTDLEGKVNNTGQLP